MPLDNRNIVLGVSAGIAAYKAPIIVRRLRELGAQVQVVLSSNADQFVTPTTLQAVSGNPVRQDLWDQAAEAAMGHIELARWADLILVAPATGNTLAKLAHGLADDLLSTVCLATAAPILLAPAMNQQMFNNAATQANLDLLRQRGHTLIGPDSGDQACGEVGPGRMTEPEGLVAAVVDRLGADAASLPLHGRTVMLTTGPTVEAIDPVRFISNHSSGKQGIGLAKAALQAGAHVIVVAGPNVPAMDARIQRIDVTSAREMEQAVHENFDGVDLFIGVAAVADYRPASAQTAKIKRTGAKGAELSLALVENPDIIAGVVERVASQGGGATRPVIVGFAAETNDTLANAREKRKRKGLDAIVLNDVSDPRIGFNSDENAAILIHEHGEICFERQPKDQLAVEIIQQVSSIFAPQLADTNPAGVRQ